MHRMFKSWRVWFWFICVVLALFAIGPKFSTDGAQISSIPKDSPLKGVLGPGDIIYQVNGVVASIDDFYKYQNYTGEINLKTNKGDLYFVIEKPFGVSVKKVDPTNINLGLDITGGVRAVIQPEVQQGENATKELLDQTISVLQTRINVYGLQESSFRPIWDGENGFIQIEVAGGTRAELTELLEHQGSFEATIPLKISDGKIQFNDKTYDVAGRKANETAVFDGITVKLVNESYVEATVYTGKDIQVVYIDPQRSRVEPSGDVYRWDFQILVTTESAQKFAKITKNLGVESSGSESYLTEPIKLYLDDNLVDELRIVSSLKGDPLTTPAITGVADSMEEATIAKKRLQSILQSGALPAKIKIVQMDSISPRLGSEFLQSAAIAGLIAFAAVGVVVFVRYRKFKYIIPMMLVLITEITMNLGASVLIGWTIDLAAIGGVIASVGTGLDDQIVILDGVLSKRKEDQEMTLKEKIKRAFFVVFGTAGVLVAAMLPLLFLGFGALRGFAITTIAGVLIGIIVTRPAYAKIVEELSE